MPADIGSLELDVLSAFTWDGKGVVESKEAPRTENHSGYFVDRAS